ncbi:MAG: 3D-(3,5/4)-trihydroxycyclohexane-1,2-dione acylhydrolase (decyclizing) [Butyricicoccaceae bacterium]
MKTVRLTTSQALVRFMENQYVSFDGVEDKFIKAFFVLPGHGNVIGLDNGIEEEIKEIALYQGKNETGQAHVAMAYAKQKHRKNIIAVSSSVGPGACNMITSAATATANCIPVLYLPGDIYVSRQPDPVLQQMEQPHDLSISTNDAFRAVCKYWDRISRPEQLMTAMISAMRVLTDPADTGAVCISLPQDVQGEAYDYPEYFFQKRVWRIERRPVTAEAIQDAADAIMEGKKPIMVCGGGVRYSEAAEVFQKFAEEFNIPWGETQAGKSAITWTHPLNMGGIGITGTGMANELAHKADLVIGVGTRYTDFTTSSKWLYTDAKKFVNINVSEFHAFKMDAVPVIADAKVALEALAVELRKRGYKSAYTTEIADARAAWLKELDRLDNIKYTGPDFVPEVNDENRECIEHFIEANKSILTQTEVLGAVNRLIDKDAIVISAAGSLPGDMQRMWRPEVPNTYHMEYGYSCMGYEVSGALGIKLACPDKEVYAMVGDGSFNMLHSELITSVQEGPDHKINVVLFDNAAYGCINNVEVLQGNKTRFTEMNMRAEGAPHDGMHKGKAFTINFAQLAASYGCKTYSVTTMEELEAAIEDSKKQTVSTLIDIKVLPKTMTEGYQSWWRTGVAEVAQRPQVNAARANLEQKLSEGRAY